MFLHFSRKIPVFNWNQYFQSGGCSNTIVTNSCMGFNQRLEKQNTTIPFIYGVDNLVMVSWKYIFFPIVFSADSFLSFKIWKFKIKLFITQTRLIQLKVIVRNRKLKFTTKFRINIFIDCVNRDNFSFFYSFHFNNNNNSTE